MEIIGRILRAEHLANALIRTALRRDDLDRGCFDVLATLRRTGPPYQLTPTRSFNLRVRVLPSACVPVWWFSPRHSGVLDGGSSILAGVRARVCRVSVHRRAGRSSRGCS